MHVMDSGIVLHLFKVKCVAITKVSDYIEFSRDMVGSLYVW